MGSKEQVDGHLILNSGRSETSWRGDQLLSWGTPVLLTKIKCAAITLKRLPPFPSVPSFFSVSCLHLLLPLFHPDHLPSETWLTCCSWATFSEHVKWHLLILSPGYLFFISARNRFSVVHSSSATQVATPIHFSIHQSAPSFSVSS